jgi:hypothetical protein
MDFEVVWLEEAAEVYQQLMLAARAAFEKRGGKGKSSKPEGLFKQIHKCVQLLRANPRHPGLATHEYHSLAHPYDDEQKVFEAYAQNRTPGAYRVFWCYGPKAKQITIIAITPHP